MADVHNPQAHIHGPISPDQAKALREGGYDSPASRAILEGIGATADSNSVALVLVNPAETWPPARGRIDGADHYVTLDARDIGTILMPGLDTELGLPPAERAVEELMTPANIIQH